MSPPAPRNPDPRNPDPRMPDPRMPESHRWAVIALLGVLVAGHLLAGAKDKEWWPLSNYALYAKEYRWRERVVPVAEGRTASGEPVALDAAALHPLDGGRIERLLRRAQFHATAETNPRAEALAAGLAALYRHNREAGLHAGPPLAEVRLLLDVRRVHPDARNARGPADRRVPVLALPVVGDPP